MMWGWAKTTYRDRLSVCLQKTARSKSDIWCHHDLESGQPQKAEGSLVLCVDQGSKD
jgi:hypothetical protein